MQVVKFFIVYFSKFIDGLLDDNINGFFFGLYEVFFLVLVVFNYGLFFCGGFFLEIYVIVVKMKVKMVQS